MAEHEHFTDAVLDSTVNPDSLAPRLALLGLADTADDDPVWDFYGTILSGWCPYCLAHALRHLAADCSVAACVGTEPGESTEHMLTAMITEFEQEEP